MILTKESQPLTLVLVHYTSLEKLQHYKLKNNPDEHHLRVWNILLSTYIVEIIYLARLYL